MVYPLHIRSYVWGSQVICIFRFVYITASMGWGYVSTVGTSNVKARCCPLPNSHEFTIINIYSIYIIGLGLHL